MVKKLAVITTHPIQYNSPYFKLLTERKKVILKVFYTWGQLENSPKYDPGFGKVIKWDVPLLEGYEFKFVKNVSKKPGSHHFHGIDNPSLIKEVEEWDADALLIFGWRFKSHFKIIRHFREKKKIIFRGDSNLLDEKPGFSIKKITRKIFLKWIYSHINLALYVGEANKEYYLKYGLTHDQLIFAPHAIDNERFFHGQENNLRSELGIAEGGIIFLFAGKLEDKKNPLLLLKAFVKMNDPKAYLLIVGDGPLELLLKKKVDELTDVIKYRIHFLNFQNQLAMPGIYKTCDVFVLPSKGPGETWGLAVNEAMASEKAILISDKCGCYLDLVQNSVNGIVFKSNDVYALMKAMKAMLHKKILSEMGVSSFEIIQGWSYTKICKAIESTLT